MAERETGAQMTLKMKKIKEKGMLAETTPTLWLFRAFSSSNLNWLATTFAFFEVDRTRESH